MSLRTEFEELARAFLARHPMLRHEWQSRKSSGSGNRLDLVFPGTGIAAKVWATAYDYQIAVGSGEEHTDFEDWGRGLTDREVAQEAFDAVASLLGEKGHLEEPA